MIKNNSANSANNATPLEYAKEYRYMLDKGSKKYLCPQCNKKRFVRYFDNITKEYLPNVYGRCDRVNNCNYHLNPYKDKYNKNDPVRVVKHIRRKRKPVYFDEETLKCTFSNYHDNTFILNLLSNVPFPFKEDEVIKVIKLYWLGTIGKAITFPFIDADGNIRAVQVKEFNEANNTIRTDFLHSMMSKAKYAYPPKWLDAYIEYGKQNKFVDCLFGANLLKHYPNNPIALVEAPKTAIYGTLHFGLPDTPDKPLWLAVYSRDTFTFDKVKALEGRTVVVYPDLSKNGSTFKLWESKAKEFERALAGTTFLMSTLLEDIANEEDKENGIDLADFLIRRDWREFRNEFLWQQN